MAEVKDTLTRRDHAIIGSLSRVRLLTATQLERLHFAGVPSGDRQCRRTLARLVEYRVLARLDRTIGGVRAGSRGHVYVLDATGQRLAGGGGPAGGGRPRRPWTPGLAFLAHALATSEIYVQVSEAERRGEIEVMGFEAEPTCWRSFTGPGGERIVLKPDAYARLGTPQFEHHWFVEVDLGTEAPSTLADKFKLYWRYWQSGREQARHDLFPQVLWLVPDAKRYAAVINVAGRQPVERWRLHRVALLADAAAVLTGGTP